MEIYYYYDYYLHTLTPARKHQNALVRYTGGTYTRISHGYSIFHLSELMDLELRLEINSKMLLKNTTQPAITCSTLSIETLEQGVKYAQS